jgi:hypothetical protein
MTKPLTVQMIREQVKAIRAFARDHEAAHGMEDILYCDVLRTIAGGTVMGDEACQLAKAALATRRIKFERWCA